MIPGVCSWGRHLLKYSSSLPQRITNVKRTIDIVLVDIALVDISLVDLPLVDVALIDVSLVDVANVHPGGHMC